MSSRLAVRSAALLVAALTVAGCSSIPINVGTTEPVKVDIAMKVDVYQHADPGAAKKVVVQDTQRLAAGTTDTDEKEGTKQR